MTINVTGTVLASVLFEHSNSICDKVCAVFYFVMLRIFEAITNLRHNWEEPCPFSANIWYWGHNNNAW